MNACVKLISALKRSTQMHSTWYREQYPDVAALGMDPAAHYLKYGAAMERNPGKDFNTKFYLETYPDVALSNINPLLHYTLYGQQNGYARSGARKDSHRAARAQIETIRGKLLSLGFTEQPLAELDQIMQASDNPAARALAARELALWHMREKTEAGYRTALTHIATARKTAPDLEFRSRLSVAELLCHHFLGQSEEGRAAYDRAALAGEVTPDVTLAWVNFQQTPTLRVAWINQVLKRYDIPPVGLLEDESLLPYDRLTSAEPLSTVMEEPKVTVLIAAYEAAEMLPTALRSLQAQTWQNLEIIVIDDYSPSLETCEVAERFAVNDPRIRLMRMEQNGGAYVARNRGLDAATGEYITLHDADDWSHPLKIETQVRFMEGNPDVMGCTSEQARCQNDLSFSKIRGSGDFTVFNTSSFLWRRIPVREALGYWDTVRFGADTEFMGRMEKVFGERSLKKIPTGPLSFQREALTSITSDPVKGIGDGFYYGVRKEYYDAQVYHRETAGSLRYTSNPAERPFKAPSMMLPTQSEPNYQFAVIYCGDFREKTPEVKLMTEEAKALHAAGRRVALVDECKYINAPPNSLSMCDSVRSLINDGTVQVLIYGDEAVYTEMRRMNESEYPSCRYLPNLSPEKA